MASLTITSADVQQAHALVEKMDQVVGKYGAFLTKTLMRDQFVIAQALKAKAEDGILTITAVTEVLTSHGKTTAALVAKCPMGHG